MQDNTANTLEGALARVEQRAASALDIYERFIWFEAQLQLQRHAYSVEQLEGFLHGPVTLPAQRERILVLLANHSSEHATEALRRWSPTNHTQRHFKRIALSRRGALRASDHTLEAAA